MEAQKTNMVLATQMSVLKSMKCAVPDDVPGFEGTREALQDLGT